MEFLEGRDLFGSGPSKEIPCLTGEGKPTAATVGAVGCLYMDTDKGVLYKCTKVENGVYTWTQEAGLYYTPVVTQPSDTTMQIAFRPSVSGAPIPAPVVVELPTGSSDSGENVNLTTAQIEALHGMFKVCAYDDSKDVSGAYAAFLAAFGITDSGEEEPDEPVVPEKTLTSISAVYNGGDVPVGTAVADLTGIVVTAHYSNGSTETVTGYTLSGTITEGANTVTVSYGGKTAAFTVTGVVEDEPVSYTRVAYLEGDGASGIATNFKGNVSEPTLFDVKVDLMYNSGWGGIVGQISQQKLLGIRQKSIYWSGVDQEMFDTLTSADAEPIPVHIVEGTANVITVYDDNGNSIGTIEGTASESSNYFSLFGYGSAFADRVDNYSKCRIREVTFTRSGEIVKHYIPVLDSDGTPCMYETVDGEFLYNVGTGTFTAGEVI